MSSYHYHNNFPRAKNYKTTDELVKAFPHLAGINGRQPEKDPTTIEEARCFIMRSNSDDDIHKVRDMTPRSTKHSLNLLVDQVLEVDEHAPDHRQAEPHLPGVLAEADPRAAVLWGYQDRAASGRCADDLERY